MSAAIDTPIDSGGSSEACFTKESACIVSYEKQTYLREASACLATKLHPVDGSPAVIRVDPAPGFMGLKNDEPLKSLRLSLEIGRVKNPNKNPVVEKAILELEEKLLKQEPTSGPVSQLSPQLGLVIAVARLNSCIRYSGLSARELWTQRSQFTHEQLSISDRESKKISNGQELIQSYPISCPQNQKGNN